VQLGDAANVAVAHDDVSVALGDFDVVRTTIDLKNKKLTRDDDFTVP